MELLLEADILEINGILVDRYAKFEEVDRWDDLVFVAATDDGKNHTSYEVTAEEIEDGLFLDVVNNRTLTLKTGDVIKFIALTTL